MINELSFALSLFLLLFTIFHTWKPSLVYNEHGHIRHFGIGYSKRTVVPLFIVSILLAIMAYSIAISIIP